MLQLHQQLNAGWFPNCRKLADELEVSSKTIQRDIEFMRYQLGLPIEYDQLHLGFIYTEPVTDQPSAALVTDLKARGLLDDTLVIWGGEFGRTPFVRGDITNAKAHGRDHHPRAFTMWLAGGGVKRGHIHGASDDFAFHAVENPVHVHDLQATLMHLCGINHERFTYKFQGRNFRLTDVHGDVVNGILA